MPIASRDASPASFGRTSATPPIPSPLSTSFPNPGSLSIPGRPKDLDADELHIIELLGMPSPTLHPTLYNKSHSNSIHLIYRRYIAIADAISVLQTKKDINPKGEVQGITEHNVKNIIINKNTYGDWVSAFRKLDKANPAFKEIWEYLDGHDGSTVYHKTEQELFRGGLKTVKGLGLLRHFLELVDEESKSEGAGPGPSTKEKQKAKLEEKKKKKVKVDEKKEVVDEKMDQGKKKKNKLAKK